MKVVHISTYDNGGAGNAALRLHLGLLEIGADSTFLCLRKSTTCKNVVEFTQKPRALKSTFVRTPFNAVGLPIDKGNRNIKKLSALRGVYEVFTFPDSNADILTHPAVKNADIIHLHWVARYLDYPSFFNKNKKPVVWTLHDMNPIQGGFHYYGDVVRNKKIFELLENKLKKQKTALIKHCKKLTVVAPSQWLHQLAKQYDGFQHAHHFHIAYGIDTNLFKDYGRDAARTVLGLPKDKVLISFVSADIHNYRKGFDLLYNAITKCGELNDVIFCAAGAMPDSSAEGNFFYLGSIKDERLMAILYAASDGYVLPSREDNLPNVMLESMSCGTPVLSFATGGMTDLIQPGFNGELSADISSNALADSLKLFIENIKEYNRSDIRSFIVDNYNLSLQANKYMEVYSHAQN